MEVENFFGHSYGGYEPHTHASGFGATADDYTLDMNKEFLRNRPATFFMKITGESMINAGIHIKDIAIVDKSIQAVNGRIVIARIDGEMLIRRYQKTFNKLLLIPETHQLSTIDVSEFSDFKVWGVVTYIIKPV